MEHHEHDHHGHHHHHVPDLKRINQAFYVGIGANALYTLIEFVIGIRINSLALLSDASHNLSDVATLIISLLGMKLAQSGATKLYTYGYKKASILASFVNAVILCLIVIKIGVESIERFFSSSSDAGRYDYYHCSDRDSDQWAFCFPLL